MIELPTPETDWAITYDKDVVEQSHDLRQSDKELWENIRSTLTDIVENPLKGAAKTGELTGCRATHIQHLAVVWKLRSEVGGEPITRREQLDALAEVYVHDICHHDNITEAVTGVDNPADITSE